MHDARVVGGNDVCLIEVKIRGAVSPDQESSCLEKYNIPAKNVRRITWEETYGSFKEMLEQVTSNNTTKFLGFDLKTKDGKRLHVEGSMSCYYRGDELVALRGFFESKTARPVKDNLSGIALERIFLEFHDKECSLAEPCFDDD